MEYTIPNNNISTACPNLMEQDKNLLRSIFSKYQTARNRNVICAALKVLGIAYNLQTAIMSNPELAALFADISESKVKTMSDAMCHLLSLANLTNIKLYSPTDQRKFHYKNWDERQIQRAKSIYMYLDVLSRELEIAGKSYRWKISNLD